MNKFMYCAVTVFLICLSSQPQIMGQESKLESVSSASLLRTLDEALKEQVKAFKAMSDEEAASKTGEWYHQQLRAAAEKVLKKKYRISIPAKEATETEDFLVKSQWINRRAVDRLRKKPGLQMLAMTYFSSSPLSTGKRDGHYVDKDGYLRIDLKQLHLDDDYELTPIRMLAYSVSESWEAQPEFALSQQMKQEYVTHMLAQWMEGMKEIQIKHLPRRGATSLQKTIVQQKRQAEIDVYTQQFFSKARPVNLVVKDVKLASKDKAGKYEIELGSETIHLNYINVNRASMPYFYTNEDVSQLKVGDRIQCDINFVNYVDQPKGDDTSILLEYEFLRLYSFLLTNIQVLEK